MSASSGAVSPLIGPPEPTESARRSDAAAGHRRPPRVAVARWVHASATTITTWGVTLAAVGCGLVAVGWWRVAREALVYRQLPYLVSAGFTGLALVLIGLTALNMGARQRDQLAAERQLDLLGRRLERAIAPDGGRPGQGRAPLAVVRPDGDAADEAWAHLAGEGDTVTVTRAFEAVFAVVGLLLLAGFVSIGLTWYGVATNRDVAHQLPYVVSGGFLALILVGLAAVLANASFRSWLEASRRARMDEALSVLDRYDTGAS